MQPSLKPGIGRLAPALVIAAGVVSGSTACGYINPQETTRITPATNGINTTVGPVKLEDLLILSEGAAKPGRVLGAITNTTGGDITVTPGEESGATVTIPVKARSQRLLNTDASPVTLTRSGGSPGSMVPVRISADGTSQDVQIPVLDNTFKEYAPYVPGLPNPSPTSSAPSNTPSPAGTSPVSPAPAPTRTP
jgi:hypothetical protein